jgi:hypothetical protein
MTPNMQITDADLQTLLAQNPLAAEQLRRIMAERQNAELTAELEKARNGHAEGQGIPEEAQEVGGV